MKFGVCEFSFPVAGPAAIAMAHEAGYEGMQITDGGSFRMRYPFCHASVQERYLRAAEENDISFQAMHLQELFNAQFMKARPDSAEGKTARECVKHAAKACKEMGIPAVMITIIRIENPEQYSYAVENLKYTLDICGQQGIRVTMENDIPADAFLQLRSEVGEGLFLCFDTMNVVVNGIGYPEEIIPQVGLSVIDHFHVKDCVENEHGFMTKYTTPMRLIGEGHTHAAEAGAYLKAQGYDGWVISENFYTDAVYGEEDYISLAKKDVTALRKLFG